MSDSLFGNNHRKKDIAVLYFPVVWIHRNQCRDPMNNNNDCRVGQLTKAILSLETLQGGRHHLRHLRRNGISQQPLDKNEIPNLTYFQETQKMPSILSLGTHLLIREKHCSCAYYQNFNKKRIAGICKYIGPRFFIFLNDSCLNLNKGKLAF